MGRSLAEALGVANVGPLPGEPISRSVRGGRLATTRASRNDEYFCDCFSKAAPGGLAQRTLRRRERAASTPARKRFNTRCAQGQWGASSAKPAISSGVPGPGSTNNAKPVNVSRAPAPIANPVRQGEVSTRNGSGARGMPALTGISGERPWDCGTRDDMTVHLSQSVAALDAALFLGPGRHSEKCSIK